MPHTRPDLSLVVVSHGHLDLVRKYLPSVFRTGCQVSIEVVLIDNLPDGEAARWVGQNVPGVRVYHNSSTRSFAENVNVALRDLTTGRYLVVSNPDVQYLPGVFDKAVAFLDLHPDVGIGAPQLLNPDGSRQPSCRRFSTPMVVLLRGLKLDRILGRAAPLREYLMSDMELADPADVDWTTGALMFIRRTAVEAIGGMDERYRVAYSEDQDLCCRMWRAGWRVTFIPQARAIHDHQRTGVRRPWSRLGRAQLVNAVRMFHKFGWRLTRS